MSSFILEIGSEEIPSRFLKNQAKDIVAMFETALDEAGLKHGAISSWETPRRLTVRIDDLADSQSERDEIILGPPAKIAFDAQGQPTPALQGFAKTNGVAVDDVFRQQTDKGEYIAIRKHEGGRGAREILAEICPAVIQGLNFPKSMRWGSYKISYARPLRWIVALLDDEVVPFSVGPVESGRKTHGHRVHGAGEANVASVDDYAGVLEEKCQIILDPAKRREKIISGGNRQAEVKGARIQWEDGLLEEVEGLVEHPVALLGDFDPSYLEIPEEVLLTSMRSHQKSFGVRRPDGALAPHFLTVLNLAPEDMDTVKRGWERVLRARLEDARFFWRSDLSENFGKWLEKLDHVIFIGPLGSMGDKGRRLEKLCAWLSANAHAGDVQLAARAGKLAKADLVSGMVGEFDDLQGIMGGIYARKWGENEEVAEALQEQYLPAGPDSPLPATPLGAILSIADKADTLAGCFGLNKIPTGATDPNGLRRCALGIIRILLNQSWNISVKELFAEARKLYADKKWVLSPDEALSKLDDFFAARLRNYFINQGYNVLLVDAALASGSFRVTDCKARLDALTAFSKQPDYEKNVQTLKRLENIAKKAEAGDIAAWDAALLQEEAEKELAATLNTLLPELDALLSKDDYAGALQKLGAARGPVDNFFDKVMVNCEDEKLRRNRLGLLNALRKRFNDIAEFSLLQI